ncbi:MAG: imidazole glycerol phosphate synthase subunit HisH [Pseudomonadota bacterium]
MTQAVAIIDSGGANIASLLYAFKRLDAPAVLTTDADTIRSADRVILPGVGAAGDAMQRLRDAQLIDVIRGLTQPVLGVCLGMQLLVDASEEEDVECLGVIPGRAQKLPASVDYPVPNMGWCAVQKRTDHAALSSIADGSYFYFVHSYAVPVSDTTIATATHVEPFAAVIAKDNFWAAQFHPERSSTAGQQLLARFLKTAS